MLASKKDKIMALNYLLPSGSDETSDTSASGMESGSASDSGSGSGGFPSQEYKEDVSVILELQKSIPYKSREYMASFIVHKYNSSLIC